MNDEPFADLIKDVAANGWRLGSASYDPMIAIYLVTAIVRDGDMIMSRPTGLPPMSSTAAFSHTVLGMRLDLTVFHRADEARTSKLEVMRLDPDTGLVWMFDMCFFTALLVGLSSGVGLLSGDARWFSRADAVWFESPPRNPDALASDLTLLHLATGGRDG